MTDRPRPYHRAEAERLLDYADDWAAQAGELSPEASERACLARAQVHALLAIHDTLADLKPEPVTYPRPSGPVTMTHPWPPWPSTLPDVDAADRYAANEERQREAAEPDPLDEDDHRDRLDSDGDIWQRVHEGCWMEPGFPPVFHVPGERLFTARLAPLTFTPGAECSRCGETYPGTAEATLEHHRACTGETPENPMGDARFGPLAFAPDADGAPSVTPPMAGEPAGDAAQRVPPAVHRDRRHCERTARP